MQNLAENRITFKEKFIGDRAFYKRVLAIAVPIMVQTGITNFVSLLDNIMVGRTGTEQMSGVAIVNQLLFVFYLCIFGGFAGAGIFTAQYYGAKDDEGIRRTFRYKLWLGIILTSAALIIFSCFGSELVSLYLNGSSDGGNLEAARGYAMDYMFIVLLGLPAFAVVQIYANTLRECGETVVPMRAGITAVAVNLVFNYLLIYGKFGFPRLGVKGAAVATVLSRFAELAVVAIWAHTHKDRCPYMKGIYSTLLIPGNLVRKFFLTGSPLLVNEALWSAGMAMLTQCYSMRGLNVVAGQNIASTVSKVFNVVFFAMGDSIAIIIGQHLGAGDFKRAKDEDNKIIAFAIFIATLVGTAIFITSPFFPRIYNTTPEAKLIATRFLMVQALVTPQIALLHTSYFTLRSGGRTVITFLFDSVFMWVVSVPVAFILSRFTSVYVIWIFFFVNMADLLKGILGVILVKKGVWMKNIVSDKKELQEEQQ
ncbi:MAG: MATE family efflux transporter [Clostridia bacterium]|nr:MATE family efflux transporter [Clostridia bacterium]